VHRVPGGERQAVFAYHAEIDAWLLKNETLDGGAANSITAPSAGAPSDSDSSISRYSVINQDPAAGLSHATGQDSPAGWWWKPIFTLRRITLAGLLLATLAIVAFGLVFMSRSPSRRLDKVAFSGNSVQAWSPTGNLLWTYSFGQTLYEEDKSDPARIQIPGLGEGGKKQVIVMAPFYIPGQPTSSSDALFALSSSGDLRWRRDFNQTFRFGKNAYGPPWCFGPFGAALVTGDDSDASIWTAANSAFWSPSDLVKLDSDGHLLAEFVNWGHIHVLHHYRSPSGSFILAGGISNECNCAMLAILREDQPSGSSPSMASPGFRCENCPPGQPYRYLLFPRSEVAAATDFTYNQVRGILSSEEGIRLVVKEARNGRDDLGADWDMYELSPGFVPRTFAVSDHMLVLHRQLETEGKLKHSIERCPELHQPRSVKVWSPEEGWKIVSAEPAPAHPSLANPDVKLSTGNKSPSNKATSVPDASR